MPILRSAERPHGGIRIHVGTPTGSDLEVQMRYAHSVPGIAHVTDHLTGLHTTQRPPPVEVSVVVAVSVIAGQVHHVASQTVLTRGGHPRHHRHQRCSARADEIGTQMPSITGAWRTPRIAEGGGTSNRTSPSGTAEHRSTTPSDGAVGCCRAAAGLEALPAGALQLEGTLHGHVALPLQLGGLQPLHLALSRAAGNFVLFACPGGGLPLATQPLSSRGHLFGGGGQIVEVGHGGLGDDLEQHRGLGSVGGLLETAQEGQTRDAGAHEALQHHLLHLSSHLAETLLQTSQLDLGRRLLRFEFFQSFRRLDPGCGRRIGAVLRRGDVPGRLGGRVVLRPHGGREHPGTQRHHQHQGSPPHRVPTLPEVALPSRDVTPPAPLHLDGVGLQRDGRWIIDDVTWTVESGQRWLVLGANGSGKTSLLRIASLYEHPTTGRVEVLGETLGHTEVRTLRRRIGVISAALAAQLRPTLTAHEVVLTARRAALEPWWHTYDDDDHRRADESLELLGVGALAHRALATLSSGEAQRVLLARALVNDPALVLLDEPSARLDLGGREHLVVALGELMSVARDAAMVLVTHHLDEVPPAMTHALLLRQGRVLASGAFDEVITSSTLSECFGLSLTVERRRNGRLSATAAG